METVRRFRGSDDSGREVLVTLYDTEGEPGMVEIATRELLGEARWSIPTRLEEVPE
jgi:hypothetical protein